MKPYSDTNRLKLQNNLATIRKIAGWTSSDLADLIGVTKQTISNLENHRSIMTKTQYIAIRAILDYEMTTNSENTVLAQVVNVLLDSEDVSDEDKVKIDAAVSYALSAKEKGLNNAMIAATVATLATSLGLSLIVPSIAASTLATKTAPLWLEAIQLAKKKTDKKGNLK